MKSLQRRLAGQQSASVVKLFQKPAFAQHIVEEDDEVPLQGGGGHIAAPHATVVDLPVGVDLPVLLDAQQAKALLVEDEEDRPALVVGLHGDRLAVRPHTRHGRSA